jgi:hypothetical protein
MRHLWSHYSFAKIRTLWKDKPNEKIFVRIFMSMTTMSKTIGETIVIMGKDKNTTCTTFEAGPNGWCQERGEPAFIHSWIVTDLVEPEP